MNDSQKHWAGMFGGLRVPFDFRMIIIGFLAIIVFLTGNYIINIFAEEPYLLSRSIDCIFRSLGTTAHNFFHTVYSMLPGSHVEVLADEIAPNAWACGTILVWGLIIVVWFGALISRLTALRIAKEEKASILNAVRFVWRRKLSLLLTPITIVILFALLYACNWILGCIGTQMTAAGTVVFILLFVLVLIASFFMVCLSILLLFGVHLIPACIATEGCDGIETFISIFNYMFVRPWSYILYNVMIVFSLIFLVFAGGMFLDLVYQSSQISATQDILSYHFDKVDNFVRVNYASLEGKSLPIFYLKQDALEKAIQQYESFSPEEQAKRTQPCVYSAGMRDVWAYISGAMVDSWVLDPVQNETIRCEHRMTLCDLWKLSKFWTCIATILGLIYCIIFYGLCGYLFAYVFVATTTVYFLLRKEVDDINFDEVWDEEKHREFLKTLKTVQKKTIADYTSMFSNHTKKEAENIVAQESFKEETKAIESTEEKTEEAKSIESSEEKQEEAKSIESSEEKQEEAKSIESTEEKQEAKSIESSEKKQEEAKSIESSEKKQEEAKSIESSEEKQEEAKSIESSEEKTEEQANITSEEESRKERKRKKLQLMKNKLEAARAKANENNLENKQEANAQLENTQEENKQLENQEAVQEENKQEENAQLENIQEENKQEEVAQQQEQEPIQEENKQEENVQQQENTQEEIAQQLENTPEAVQEDNKQEENAQQQEQESVQEENKQLEATQEEQEAVQEENKQQEEIAQQQEQESVQEENKQEENAQQQENTPDNIAQQQEQEPVQEEQVQKDEPEAQAPVQEESVQEESVQERENTRKIAQEFAQSIAKVDEEQSTSQENTQETTQEENAKNETPRVRHMPDFLPEPDIKPEHKKMPDFLPEPDTISEPKKATEPAIAEDSGSSDWDNFTFDAEPTPPKEKEVPPIEDEDSHSKIKLESGTMSIPLMTRPRYKYSARRRMEHQKDTFKKDDFID